MFGLFVVDLTIDYEIRHVSLGLRGLNANRQPLLALTPDLNRRGGGDRVLDKAALATANVGHISLPGVELTYTGGI